MDTSLGMDFEPCLLLYTWHSPVYNVRQPRFFLELHLLNMAWDQYKQTEWYQEAEDDKYYQSVYKFLFRKGKKRYECDGFLGPNYQVFVSWTSGHLTDFYKERITVCARRMFQSMKLSEYFLEIFKRRRLMIKEARMSHGSDKELERDIKEDYERSRFLLPVVLGSFVENYVQPLSQNSPIIKLANHILKRGESYARLAFTRRGAGVAAIRSCKIQRQKTLLGNHLRYSMVNTTQNRTISLPVNWSVEGKKVFELVCSLTNQFAASTTNIDQQTLFDTVIDMADDDGLEGQCSSIAPSSVTSTELAHPPPSRPAPPIPSYSLAPSAVYNYYDEVLNYAIIDTTVEDENTYIEMLPQ